MKYNLSKIMTKAWELFRNFQSTHRGRMRRAHLVNLEPGQCVFHTGFSLWISGLFGSEHNSTLTV